MRPVDLKYSQPSTHSFWSPLDWEYPEAHVATPNPTVYGAAAEALALNPALIDVAMGMPLKSANNHDVGDFIPDIAIYPVYKIVI
mmetsp:Transcript_24896/g.69657  ORF Transcript_24896/g.69657 Transcript_24896/m.69657 type:complete len:85 (+) Transcript_24896:222-476(+)